MNRYFHRFALYY